MDPPLILVGSWLCAWQNRKKERTRDDDDDNDDNDDNDDAISSSSSSSSMGDAILFLLFLLLLCDLWILFVSCDIMVVTAGFLFFMLGGAIVLLQ